jgi:beta-mannosidase
MDADGPGGRDAGHDGPPERRTLPLTTSAGITWTLQAANAPAATVPADLLHLVDAPIPATVPGEVHVDLLTAGLIPDPFDGNNEGRLHWIGRTDWTYRARFDWHDNGRTRHDLVALGLDTVATVSLNGAVVASTANQHRGYRFDVTELLVDGSNEVTVAFEAPVDAAERLSAELGPRPHVNTHPFNAIRKMAANYGWDWGPDVATAGIWKPVSIESWSGVRIASVRPLAGVQGDDGVLETHVLLEWDGRVSPSAAEVTVEVAATTATAVAEPGQASVVVTNQVPGVELWWPRGYGAQPLYDVRVQIAPDRRGSSRDSWEGRVGFRTVTLDTAPDEDGSPFAFAVNGAPIYVRGANWIPDDAFLTRMTPQRYRRAVGDAVAANVNLLRVWGGGIYEDQAFYRACDELGVLVWQDFLLACAAYAEEQPLRGEVEAEAREAITRLSQHASLAVWNGGNENIWGYVDWHWRPALAGRTWGRGYYLDLLPALVAELDPRTPYSPGSPFSFDEFIHPNDPNNGTVHIWDVWNARDYDGYRDYRPRFVSEFGFQGPPAWSTLTSVVHDDVLDPYGPTMLVHQKADDGNGKLERGLGRHLPKWRTVDDWHWATQLNQARAIAFGIEHFRSLSPRNRGSIVWQLNDNWPVISWAAVDAHGIRKPLWFALRRVFADRLLTIQPREGRPTLVAHNESDEPWQATLRVRQAGTGLGDETLAESHLAIDVAGRGSAEIAIPDAVLEVRDQTREYLSAVAEGSEGQTVQAFWYFVEDTELALSRPDRCLTVATERTADGYAVTASASALVKDLTLLVDRVHADARVDSGMVTLEAGGTHTFMVTAGAVDPASFGDKLVMRSANDLVS